MSAKAEEQLTRDLPYGQWTCADGREVLFNRRYQPIWQCRPGTRAESADPKEWVMFVKQEWFFNDGNPPWRNTETLRRCSAILSEWTAARKLAGDCLN